MGMHQAVEGLGGIWFLGDWVVGRLGSWGARDFGIFVKSSLLIAIGQQLMAVQVGVLGLPDYKFCDNRSGL